MKTTTWILLAFFISAGAVVASIPAEPSFPPTLESYTHAPDASLGQVLRDRVAQEPFNLVATLIFLLAIAHTFLAPAITRLAHRVQHDFERRNASLEPGNQPAHDRSIPGNCLHYLGEVEAVFGLWALVLFVALAVAKGSGTALHYVNNRVDFTEAIFVVVIMTIASSGPVLRLAEGGIARLAGESSARWWWSILTLGPLLGSFITEPAAMTISALLLAKEFYRLKPGACFQYATLGLLFVNVSVGGTLTHFAAPPVLMVSSAWGWDTPFMALHFGLRAVIGIVLCNGIYFLAFRREFAALARNRVAEPVEKSTGEESVPPWITAVNVAFLAVAVLAGHYPVLVVAVLLFFLAFVAVTAFYQGTVDIRPSLLVGFFLAGLVIHGGLQAWWIAPVLSSLGQWPLLLGSTLLTAFNDNAAITYLASLVPGLSDPLKLAVMSGAVCGGGLTVIANAPNPAGQSILSRFFDGGVSPVKLALGALAPTVVMLAVFSLFR